MHADSFRRCVGTFCCAEKPFPVFHNTVPACLNTSFRHPGKAFPQSRKAFPACREKPVRVIFECIKLTFRYIRKMRINGVFASVNLCRGLWNALAELRKSGNE